MVSLLAIGFVMCQTGMRSQIHEVRDLVRGLFMRAATALGVLSLSLAVAGVALADRWLVVALGVTLVATRLVATIHHDFGDHAARVV